MLIPTTEESKLSQNVELQKIKARIKALASKTVDRGCSENEAMAAMAMVGKLLNQYNLTMSEIDVREQVCSSITIPTGRSRNAIDSIVMPLASLFEAKVWRSTRRNAQWKKESSYIFFGTEDDLEMIKYLYHVIEQALANEKLSFKHSAVYVMSRSKKAATRSFGYGMAFRIAERLREQKAEMNAAEAFRTSTTGTSLVVLKGQLVTDEFAKLNLKLTTVASRRTVSNNAAFAKGHEAGNRVNLNRPINDGSNAKVYLT
jgi:hypothetical protein